MTPDEEARIRAEEKQASIDFHMLQSLATSFKISDNGGTFFHSFNDGDVADLLRRMAEALRSGPDTDYVCVRREELERFATSAALLLANAEGCAVNHYGEDHALHGTPGWLSDCAADVARLRSLLKEKG